MTEASGSGEQHSSETRHAILVSLYGWKFALLTEFAKHHVVPTSFIRSLAERVKGECEHLLPPELVPRYSDMLSTATGEWGCVRPPHQRRLMVEDARLVEVGMEEAIRGVEALAGAFSIDAEPPEQWLDNWLREPIRAQDPNGSEGSETVRTPAFPEDSWQGAVVGRLSNLLTTRQMEDALGKSFLRALRSWRRSVEGRDTAGTKAELVEALLVQHGTDLLRNCKELRLALGRAAGVETPDAFHSGKAAAMRFVHDAGLPIELAGTIASPTPPAALFVRGPQSLRALEDFQMEAKQQILHALRGGRTVICSLPTGGGKTRVAIEAVVEWMNELLERGETEAPVIVWVAHTRELCDQAVEAFRAVWEVRAVRRSLLLGSTATGALRLRAQLQELMQEPWDALVLVTTPIVGRVAVAADGWLRALEAPRARRVRALVIDEAHRAAAPTYGRLLDTLRATADTVGLAVIGLTATPFRTVLGAHEATEATAALREVFADGLILPSALGNDPKGELITRRCLARPVYRALKGSDLSSIQTTFADEEAEEAVDQQLSKLAGKDLARRRRVFTALERLLKEVPDARVLYFGPTVADAEVISFLLLQSGYRAVALSARTHASVRRETIRQFRAGSHQVLCNHGVLTTGFDDPLITHVVIARPTVSLVLYEQMIGRGLRGPLFGGTEECHIHSVEDRFGDGPTAQRVWRDFIESWTPHVSVEEPRVRRSAESYL
jgi:superfamily II DNA or RNA helicase